jgi:arylsulfatase A
MNRRKFVTAIGATLAVSRGRSQQRTTADALNLMSQEDSSRRPPNVVFMICDDLGYGDLGCYGSKISTPNIDRLAASGLRFMQHTTPHPICSASRAAVLTGMYPTRSNVTGAYMPLAQDGLSLDAMTLADSLSYAGYATMAIGKWHLGSKKEYLPTKRGFAHFVGVPYSVDMNPLPLLHDDRIAQPDADRSELTAIYTREAVDFINRRAGNESPFFLYLAYSTPHIPLHSSKAFRGRSALGRYGDVVEEIDWSVGQIVRALEKSGALHDTLIVFTSDHGPWFQGSAGPLRGRKGETYEGGVRIPMIVSMPGRIPQGQSLDTLTSHMDFFPTFANLCGGKVPERAFDGCDIWELLTKPDSYVKRQNVLLGFSGWDIQCARWKQWKLHVTRLNIPAYLPQPVGGLTNAMLRNPELYDLALDSGESYDVAAIHSEVVSTMQESIQKQLSDLPDPVQTRYRAALQHVTSEYTPADAYSSDNINSEPGHGAWLVDEQAKEVLKQFE